MARHPLLSTSEAQLFLSIVIKHHAHRLNNGGSYDNDKWELVLEDVKGFDELRKILPSTPTLLKKRFQRTMERFRSSLGVGLSNGTILPLSNSASELDKIFYQILIERRADDERRRGVKGSFSSYYNEGNISVNGEESVESLSGQPHSEDDEESLKSIDDEIQTIDNKSTTPPLADELPSPLSQSPKSPSSSAQYQPCHSDQSTYGTMPSQKHLLESPAEEQNEVHLNKRQKLDIADRTIDLRELSLREKELEVERTRNELRIVQEQNKLAQLQIEILHLQMKMMEKKKEFLQYEQSR
jgi:hypothetical protein